MPPQPADVRTAEQSVPLDWDAVGAYLAGKRVATRP